MTSPPPPPVPAPTAYCAECGRPTAVAEMARFGEVLICPGCKYNYAQKLREGVMPARAMIYGGFWIRFVAVIIDGIIMAVVGSILQFAFVGRLLTMPRMEPGQMPSAEVLSSMFGMIGLLSLLNMAIGACYEGIFVGKLGATPGKMALGLKVVRPNGSPVSMGRAFGRYFAKMLSSLILMIGYIMAGFDSEKRALHDMICDTRVMQTR